MCWRVRDVKGGGEREASGRRCDGAVEGRIEGLGSGGSRVVAREGSLACIGAGSGAGGAAAVGSTCDSGLGFS